MSTSAGNAKRRKGFTLIELVVVCVIIAVLIGLLLPVILRSHLKAYETTCMNNLHQIYLAVRMYADDNDGRYPLILTCRYLGHPRPVVQGVYPDYLRNKQVFICPLDPTQGRGGADTPGVPKSYNYCLDIGGAGEDCGAGMKCTERQLQFLYAKAIPRLAGDLTVLCCPMHLGPRAGRADSKMLQVKADGRVGWFPYQDANVFPARFCEDLLGIVR